MSHYYVLLLILWWWWLSFCNTSNILQNGDCRKWYGYDGCKNVVRFTKTIRNSDIAPFLSTTILTDDPEKRLNILVDFGVPSYHLNRFVKSLLEDVITLNDTLSPSTTEINKDIMSITNNFIREDNIFPHPVLYIPYGVYNNKNLNTGIRLTNIDEDAFMTIITKGKYMSLPVFIIEDSKVESVSNAWEQSRFTADYQALLNLGRHSTIWTRFDNMIIDDNNIVLSSSLPTPASETAAKSRYMKSSYNNNNNNNDNMDSIFFSEHKIIIQCDNDKYEPYNIATDIYGQTSQKLNSVCISKNNVYVSDYSSTLSNNNNEDNKSPISGENNKFELEIDLMSSKNYLPASLYFLLYTTNGKLDYNQQMTYIPRVTKKSNDMNYIKIAYIEDGDKTIESLKGIKSNEETKKKEWTFYSYSKDLTFELNTLSENRIVLGASVFKYFSRIHYDRIEDSYTLWISMNTNRESVLIILSFIIIIEVVIFIRWYLTTHRCITQFIFLKIILDRKDFYYNQSQAIFEIAATLLSIVSIGLVGYLLFTGWNISSETLYCFIILTTIVGFTIIFNTVLIHRTRDQLYSFISSKFSRPYYYSDRDDNAEDLKKIKLKEALRKQQQPKLVEPFNQIEKDSDQMTLNIYSLSNSKTVFSDSLIVVSRNYTHMTMVLSTILLCLIPNRDQIATKEFLVVISILLVYHMVCYVFILYCIHRKRIQKGTSFESILWSIFIGLNILIILGLIPFVGVFILFNAINDMNTSYQLILISIISICVVTITIFFAIKMSLSSAEQWIDIFILKNNEYNKKK